MSRGKELYTVTVKIETVDDNGKTKKRNENYLVNAVDLIEAIKLVKEDFQGFHEEWKVTKAVPSTIVAVLNYTGHSPNDTTKDEYAVVDK